MYQNTGLISLIAGIVLLVWSIRFIRDQMLLTFGERLRGILRRVGQSSLLASLMGIIIAASLQSGAAASLIVTAFAERGFLSSVAAVSAVFGADLGSALMVQLLSLRSAVLAPTLLAVGGAVALGLFRDNAKPYGTIAFGFGLVLLALSIVGASLSGIAHEPLFIAILERVGSEPLITMAISALITLVLHSSVAMILALSALAATGALDSAACLALVLGANIGSSLIPLMLSARAGAPTRRVLTANLAGRVGMAAIFLAGAAVAPHILNEWTGHTARLVVDVHLIFNLAVTLVGLPAARPLAALLEKIWPDKENDEGRIRVHHLNEIALETPALALAGAAREALRVADRVERMLEAAMHYFKHHDHQSEKS